MDPSSTNDLFIFLILRLLTLLTQFEIQIQSQCLQARERKSLFPSDHNFNFQNFPNVMRNREGQKKERLSLVPGLFHKSGNRVP